MIDWGSLAANALWILGCALALAAFSYASWRASISDERLSHVLGQPSFQKTICLSGVLFCAGLAATSNTGLQAIVWGLLAILFGLSLVFTLLPFKRPIK